MDVTALINNIRDSQYFEVMIELEEPLHFNGVVPFDVSIIDNTATFKVLASTQEDAENKVYHWLWNN